MFHCLLTRFLPRRRVLPLKSKLVIPTVGLMLLSLLTSTLAFLGATAFTRNQLLRREISVEANRVASALADRVQEADTASDLLARAPPLIEAVQGHSEVALSTLNSQAVVVRDRFGLDLIQIYDQSGQARVNLMLSSLYRESLLLDHVETRVPSLVAVGDRLLVLSREAMLGDRGTVITGIDLETELNRIASSYRLFTDVGLQFDGVSVGTRDELPTESRFGGGEYVTRRAISLGQADVELVLVRPTSGVKKVTTTGLLIMIGSTVSTTLLLIGLGVWLARGIARPIERLSAAAQDVAQGDLSQVVEPAKTHPPWWIGAGDEIGLLATTFNSMVAQLRGLYQNLESEVDARTKELRTAANVARVVSSTLEVETVLRESLTLIGRRLGFSHTQVYLVEPDAETLTLCAATSEGGQALLRGGFELALRSRSLVAVAASTGESRIAQDVTADTDFMETSQFLSTGSAAAIPLLVGQRTIGVLYVQCPETNRLTSETVGLLHTVADQIALGLHNAQLYGELQGYAEELEARVEQRAAVIQAQYAQLQAVLNSTADGIIVTGEDHEFVLTNRVAEAWLTQKLSPREAELVRDSVWDLANSHSGRDERILELAGLDLQLRAAPVSGSSSHQATAVVAMHDVSHLKALDRMKSRFVSNVSHELRTPIATIKLLVHLMQKRPDCWEEYIDALAEEAEYQAQLVEDILEISRVDAGRIELEPMPTSLGGLAEDAVEKQMPEARQQGVTLLCQVTANPLAWVDPQRMTQVLTNLISNAIRYTPAGGRIAVCTDNTKQSGRRWATVTVSDTGMGIPDQERPYIFDRFFRGEKPRSMQISGTGLGLAIVKEIVQLHGGQVRVESQVDRGSVFTVRVPCAAGGAIAARAGADIDDGQADD